MGDDTDFDPLICGENYRVSSHGCLACETDDFNLVSDDAFSEDTECDGFLSEWSDQNLETLRKNVECFFGRLKRQ